MATWVHLTHILKGHRGFGYGIRNQEGEDVLNSTLPYNIFVDKTFFKERII
jgi:hypothetical protein